MNNWETIKQLYITSSLSYRILAQRHGIPLGELSRRAKAEDWVAQRAAHRRKPTVTVTQLSHRLLEKVAVMVDALPATGYSNLRYISGTLKDIRDLQKDAADTADTLQVTLSPEVTAYAD